MHLGNLFSALLAWLSARAAGGSVVLRMEDLDPDRCRPEYAVQLADDLRWLGLDWDEGYGADGPHGPYLQSQRGDYYTAQIGTLERAGLLYPCYCTRAQRLAASAPHRSDGVAVYPGLCRGLTPEARHALEQSGRAPALRMALADEFCHFTDGCQGPQQFHLQRDCGDPILRRADGVHAYQLAVVADDGAMGITQVVRGRDLLDSTPVQLALYHALGLTPPTFYHVPLLLAPDGRRLSKRDGDLDLSALRAQMAPEVLTGRLAHLAGLLPQPEEVSPAQLIPRFSWDRVRREDVFLEAWR